MEASVTKSEPAPEMDVLSSTRGIQKFHAFIAQAGSFVVNSIKGLWDYASRLEANRAAYAAADAVVSAGVCGASPFESG
jgi:hypothetical protein